MILLIEDNLDHAYLVQKALPKLTEDIIHVKDGGEAMKFINRKDNSISCLIADVNIAGQMESSHLINTLKGSPSMRDIPIIVISMNPPNTNIEKLLNKFPDIQFVQKNPDSTVLEADLGTAIAKVLT